MSFLRSRKSPSASSRGECANSPLPAPQAMASPRHPPKGSKRDLSPRDPPGKASLTGGALAEVLRSRRRGDPSEACASPAPKTTPGRKRLHCPQPEGTRSPRGSRSRHHTHCPWRRLSTPGGHPQARSCLRSSPHESGLGGGGSGHALAVPAQAPPTESCDTRSRLLPDPPPDLASAVGGRPPRCYGHHWRGGGGGTGRPETGRPAIVGGSWLLYPIPGLGVSFSEMFLDKVYRSLRPAGPPRPRAELPEPASSFRPILTVTS